MHLIKDENGNVMPHSHEQNHEHTHDHGHDHGHDHDHSHSHACGHSHDCSSGCGSSDECRNETVALLTYMLDHNQHHAAELDQMAANLEKLGMDTAARQIREAVSDFQKGNLRLSLALTTVKEQLKEA